MNTTWNNRSTTEEQDRVLATIIHHIVHHNQDEVRPGDMHHLSPTRTQEIFEDLYMGGRIGYGKHGYIPTSRSWREVFKQQEEQRT